MGASPLSGHWSSLRTCVVLCVLATQLAACGLFFARTDFLKATSEGKLKPGQTTEEVRTLLGNPDQTKSDVAAGVQVDMWVYKQTSSEDRSNYMATTLVTLGLWGVVPVMATEPHYVVFAGGKVVSWDTIPKSVHLPGQFAIEGPAAGRVTSGTGFAVGGGYYLTNNHVVATVTNPMIYDQGEAYPATVALRDLDNDVALLKISGVPKTKNLEGTETGLRFGDVTKVKQGDRVWTLGFPLSTVLGERSILTEGTVSSIYGLGEDPRLFQISVPIQPGNSGGPLLNDQGEVIGLTVSTINAARIFQMSGAIPQNINFAVKVTYAKHLIAMLPEKEQPALVTGPARAAGLPLSTLVELVKPHVVLIKGTP